MNTYPFSNFNPAMNPAGFNMPTYQPPMQQVEIPKVNGEEGAKAYPLASNSSVLLLDMNEPLVWVVSTDAAGYKTVSPFTITPFTPEKPIKPSDLDTRLQGITARLDELEERIKKYEPDT